MKVFIFITFFALNITSTFAQNQRRDVYRVYQVDSDSNLDILNSRVENLEDIEASHKTLDRSFRDKIINKYLGEKASDFDELDKDLFIKRLIYYSQEQFFLKYPVLLKQEDYFKIKDELEDLKE